MSLINSDMINMILNTIGPKYFDDDFSQITKNRTGLFGMVSETMGTIFESSVVTNAIKARERLTITAGRETLLQEAASYPELLIPQAKPANILINIGVPVRYLLDNFSNGTDNVSFTLHKDTIITVAGVPFILNFQ